MTNKEQGIFMIVPEEETVQQQLTITAVTDFGPNNKGKIGQSLEEVKKNQLIDDVADEKYSFPRSNRWICVDTRHVAGAQAAETTADPQTAGGIGITDTAAAMMLPNQTHPLSELIAENTQQAVADDLVVVVHGAHNNKAGCGANATLRESLRSNAENIETVAPLAWTCCELLGLDKIVQKEDVIKQIENGRANAEKDELWDVTPEQVVDLMVANGAEYEELEGEHDESVTRVDFSKNAFDKVGFANDHAFVDGSSIGAFAASLGAYKAETFRRAELHGQTPYEAATKVVSAVLFNVGVCKELSNEHMFLVAVGETSQA